MEVKGLVWLGLRTDRFAETVRLFRDVMGLEPIRDEPNLVGLRMADGTEMELYSPGDDFHHFFTTGPVVGFLVDDVDAARAVMEGAGVEFIGPIQRAGGASWNHFRGPDGTVFEIFSRASDPR